MDYPQRRKRMALRLSEAIVLCIEGYKVIGWLEKYKYYAEKRIEVLENDVCRLVLQMYSSQNVYRLTIDGRCKYLGCSVRRRIRRPGETWNRGNDLPNGDIAEETLNQILGAIVFYEALEVVKNVVETEVEE